MSQQYHRIMAARSSYVCRHRDNSVYPVLEEHPLSDADRAAGILSDRIDEVGDDDVRLDCSATPLRERNDSSYGQTATDNATPRRIIIPPSSFLGKRWDEHFWT
ncbi:MAG: hypothetical protein NT069_11785 [Planctomycetota bacterium]|nr:hypothetical protein [Planctomycetota bacterium]